jgi:hypothetical protein
MTPREAEAGLVELTLPNGGRILVGFGAEVACNPDIEASVVQMMLDAFGTEDEVRLVLADYAEASGFTASVLTEGATTLVVIA